MGLLQRSFRARVLTYFVLLALVPLVVIGSMAYSSGRDNIVAEVEAHLESVATLKEQAVEDVFRHTAQHLGAAAADTHVIDAASVLTTAATDSPQYLDAYRTLVHEIQLVASLERASPILLLDATSGEIIAASHDGWEGRFREGEAYFQEGKKGDYVSELFHSFTLGRPTLVFSTPLRDSDGRLIGVLAAHINMDRLNEIMTEWSGLGETGETFLVSQSNLLVTDTVFDPGSSYRKWIFGEGVVRALGGERGIDLFRDYRDEPVIGAYRLIVDGKLALIAKQDQAEAFAPVNRLRTLIALVGGIALVAVVGAGVLLARRVTRPLSRLARYAGRVTRGEYEVPLDVRGRDEIASVSADVQAMVGQLLGTQRQLLLTDSAVRSSGSAISVSDLDGSLVHVNPALVELWGYGSPEEMLGMPSASLWKDSAEVRKPEGARGAGAFGEVSELIALRKDGSEFIAEVRAAPITDAGGRTVAWTSSTLDITERKRTDEELDKHRHQLEGLVAERTAELSGANEHLRQETEDRVRSEEAARESEEKLRAILDASPDVIHLIDINGIILASNEGFAGRMGIKIADAVGKCVYDYGPAESVHNRKAVVEKVFRTGEPSQLEDRGRTGMFESHVHPVFGPAGEVTAVAVYARDITERKKAEEALRESEAKLRDFMDAAIDGFTLFDKDLNIVEINEAALRRTPSGTTREQRVGRNLLEIAPNARESGTEKKFLDVIRTGKPYIIEDAVPGESYGHLHLWVKAFKVGEGLGLIVSDITRQKEAEETLRESEERHRTLFETMAQGVIYHDAEGAVISINPAAERIMGPEAGKWRPSDPERRGWKLVREDGSAFARDEQPLRIALNEGKEARDVVMGMRGPDGNVRLWFCTSFIPMFRPGEDKPFRIYTVTEDITERKRAEEELAKHRDRLEELVEERTRELRDAQEELVRKERLAFLGQLAGGVGHELRNPLGAIKNVAYYLKLVLKQPEPKVAESLSQMDRAVTKADRIISSLLDFARQRPPALLAGNVNDAVRGALSQVELPENVEVVTRLDDTLPQISLDPGQMGQVFENLIVNAVQAMPDGGRLTVRSKRSGAGWVAVSIADTGTGLSSENLEKVFQPLFTTRATGIGLGLALSKTIVEAHGGSIEVQGKPGAGSTFTVRLPVRSEEEREAGERLDPGATRGSEPGVSGDGDSTPSL